MEEETIVVNDPDGIHDTDIDTVPDIVLEIVKNPTITEKIPDTKTSRNGIYALALLAIASLGAIYSFIAQSCQ